MFSDVDGKASDLVLASLRDSYAIPANQTNVVVSANGNTLTGTPISGGAPFVTGGAIDTTYNPIPLSVVTQCLGAIRIPAVLYKTEAEFSDAIYRYNTIRLEPGDLDLTFPLDLSALAAGSSYALKALTTDVRYSGDTLGKIFNLPRLTLRFRVEGAYGAGQSIRLGYIKANNAVGIEQFDLTMDGVAVPTEVVQWSAQYWAVNATIPQQYGNGAEFKIVSSVPFGTGLIDESGSTPTPVQGLANPISKVYEITQNGLYDSKLGFITQMALAYQMTVDVATFAKNTAPIDISALFCNVNLYSLPAGLFDGQTIIGGTRAFQQTRLTTLPDGLFAKAALSGDWSYCFYYSKLKTIPEGCFPTSGSGVTSMNCFAWMASALTNVDSNLFKHSGSTLVSLQRAFSKTALAEIPAGLLDGCVALNDVSYMFDSVPATAIPTGLLKDAVNITTVSSMFTQSKISALPPGLFSGLSKLWTALDTFNRTPITTIPVDTFKGCVSLYDMSTCFISCDALTDIPSGMLADCVALTTMNMTFYTCTGVKTIANDLFINCPNIKDLTFTFSGLTAVEIFPVGILKGLRKLTTMRSTFERCGLNYRTVNPVPFDRNILADCVELVDLTRAFLGTGFSSIEEGALDSQTKVTSVAYCWGGASWTRAGSPLTSIPETLFSKCAQLTSIAGVFAMSQMETFPAKLFTNIPKKDQVTSLAGMFYGCNKLTSIPTGMFDGFTGVTVISTMFMGTYAGDPTIISSIPDSLFTPFAKTLTDASFCFSFSGITEFRKEWFAGATALNTIESICSGCVKLVTINPNALQDTTALVKAVSAFEGCTALTGLSDEALTPSKILQDISRIFYGCIGLTAISGKLIANTLTLYKATRAFMGTGLTSVPAGIFAGKTVLSDLTYVFADCSNLKSIELGWLTLPTSGYVMLSNAFSYAHADLTAADKSIPLNNVTRADSLFGAGVSPSLNTSKGIAGSVNRFDNAFDVTGVITATLVMNMFGAANATTASPNVGLTGTAQSILTSMGIPQSGLTTVFGPRSTVTWS